MPDTDTYGETAPDTAGDVWLSVGEAATYLGVSVSTLQRWDRSGELKAHRSPTNQRRYRRTVLDGAFSQGECAS